jgi:hypothetical protein
MKTISDIKREIEVINYRNAGLFSDNLGYSTQIDNLIPDDFDKNTVLTPPDKVIIKRVDKIAYVVLAFFILIYVGTILFGPDDNLELIYSAINFDLGIFNSLLFFIIFLTFPIACIISILRKRKPVIITKDCIYINRRQIIYFNTLLYICFERRDYHESSSMFYLKLYYNDDDDEVISINKWVVDRSYLGKILYYRMKQDKSNSP